MRRDIHDHRQQNGTDDAQDGATNQDRGDPAVPRDVDVELRRVDLGVHDELAAHDGDHDLGPNGPRCRVAETALADARRHPDEAIVQAERQRRQAHTVTHVEGPGQMAVGEGPVVREPLIDQGADHPAEPLEPHGDAPVPPGRDEALGELVAVPRAAAAERQQEGDSVTVR